MQFLQIQDSEPFSIKSLDERLKLINFYLMLEPTLCPAPLVRLDYPPPTAPHGEVLHNRFRLLTGEVLLCRCGSGSGILSLNPPGWYGTVEPTLDPRQQFQRVTILGLQGPNLSNLAGRGIQQPRDAT